MTPEEERIYLTNLLIDATDWQVSEGESRSAIELEVIDRIRKLNGQPTINVVGTPSDEVELEVHMPENNEHLASPEKVKNAKERWKEGKVRVMVNGKAAWKPIEDCEKRRCFPDLPESTKWRWVWKGEKQEPVAEVSQQVDKLSDELWADYENSNKEN